jgi:hypothetical protein
MTETDYEKLRRELREMEGRNIAHYSVLLTAYIRIRVENARMTAILSAAGIVLLVLILMTLGVRGTGKMLIVGVGLAGFFIALWISLRVLEKSVENLMFSLKEGAGQDLNADESCFAAKKFFLLGCTSLIVLGLVSAWTPKLKGMCFADKRIPKMTSQVAPQADEASAGQTAENRFQVTAEIPTASASTASSSWSTTSATVPPEASKKAGNAGVFQRGVSQ